MWITFTVMAALTWYNPMLGGVNCDNSCEWMAAGHPVAEWFDRALACPEDYPIGTIFSIEGSRWGLADGEWVCLDRGGRVIVDENGIVSLDLLKHDPIWGETLQVEVRLRRALEGSVQGVVSLGTTLLRYDGGGGLRTEWPGHPIFQRDFHPFDDARRKRHDPVRETNNPIERFHR